MMNIALYHCELNQNPLNNLINRITLFSITIYIFHNIVTTIISFASSFLYGSGTGITFKSVDVQRSVWLFRTFIIALLRCS